MQRLYHWLSKGGFKIGFGINRKTRPYKPFNEFGARSQLKWTEIHLESVFSPLSEDFSYDEGI
jgi:hypothetical protein